MVVYVSVLECVPDGVHGGVLVDVPGVVYRGILAGVHG